jgi:hypothetical protein
MLDTSFAEKVRGSNACDSRPANDYIEVSSHVILVSCMAQQMGY